MGITKKLNLNNVFLFIFLALFPFGQIIKMGVFHPTDIVVGLAAIYAIYRKFKRPKIFNYFTDFLIICSASYILSIFVFWQKELLFGPLYLFRLFCYFHFLIYVSNFVTENKNNRKILIKSLVVVSVVSAIFGWIQYFKFPDIKPFFVFGWDEHLFRIVGTFLDPSFLSLILVFGLILSPNLFVQAFLTLALAFTYSRAGYVAFAVAMVSKFIYMKKINGILILSGLLLVSILFLPRPDGEGVKLERTSSIYARIDNYNETLRIFKKYPVLGVGFNNLCLARQKYIGVEPFSSHSCSGSESSILFILATTGVLGLLSLVRLSVGLWPNSGVLFKISALALLAHSFFANSLFYTWIIAWMLILLASEKKLKE